MYDIYFIDMSTNIWYAFQAETSKKMAHQSCTAQNETEKLLFFR